MKKLIALILAAVMSFALVACGGGEEPLKSTADLSDLLGGGSKTTAESTAETTESLTNDTSVTTTLDTTTTEPPVAPDYSDHSANSKDDETERISEWEEILFNNIWYGTCHGVEGSGDTIELIFYEDGSYSARYGVGENAKTETWNFMRLYDTAGEYLENAFIQTVPDYDAEKGLYQADCFTLGITNDGEYLLRTGTDYICYPKDNAAENNEIELTVENFDTYFELVEVPIFYENEFGETDEMDLYQYYLVREEYNVSYMTDFAIEYSCVWGRKDCEVDFTNLTYTLSDFKDTTPPANVMTDRFYDIEVNGQERFGFSIGGSGKSVKKSYGSIGEVGYSVDFEILRVKGTLFLIEE